MKQENETGKGNFKTNSSLLDLHSFEDVELNNQSKFWSQVLAQMHTKPKEFYCLLIGRNSVAVI